MRSKPGGKDPRFEAPKERIQESFKDLKERKRIFNRELHILQARRMEALRTGDKELAARLKAQIEALGRAWHEKQHHLYREIREQSRQARHG